jgi:hypothetical protein
MHDMTPQTAQTCCADMLHDTKQCKCITLSSVFAVQPSRPHVQMQSRYRTPRVELSSPGSACSFSSSDAHVYRGIVSHSAMRSLRTRDKGLAGQGTSKSTPLPQSTLNEAAGAYARTWVGLGPPLKPRASGQMVNDSLPALSDHCRASASGHG